MGESSGDGISCMTAKLFCSITSTELRQSHLITKNRIIILSVSMKKYFLIFFCCFLMSCTNHQKSQLKYKESCIKTSKNNGNSKFFRIKSGDKWGFVNSKGNIVIQPVFDYVQNFSENLAVAKKNGKYGYINLNGDFSVPPKYDWAVPFSEGKGLIEVNDKWGFININGNIVIEAKFTKAHPFEQGYSKVMLQNKWFFIDKTGKIAHSRKYDKIGELHNKKTIFSSQNHKNSSIKTQTGILDLEHNTVINISDINVSFEGLPKINNGLIRFWEQDCNILCSLGMSDPKRRKKWGFIDLKGNQVIPPKFIFANSFSECFASVQSGSDEKYGFINTDGRMVISPKFDDVKDFHEGFAAVYIEKKWSYIDRSGNLISNPKFENALNFSEGLAPIQIDAKWGYIDTKGNIVITPKYKKAQQFSSGLAYIENDAVEGYINKSGSLVWSSH